MSRAVTEIDVSNQTVEKEDAGSEDANTATDKRLAPSVFEYQDYRLFLKSVINRRREKFKTYNMKKFAEALGFSSHAGLAMILNGQRELRPPYLDRCIRNLKLNVNERLYFEAMVRAGALSPAKRRTLLREVRFLSESWEPPVSEDGIRLIDYGLVHQILCLHRRYMTVAQIVGQFRYPISHDKIREVLAFMLERGQAIRNPATHEYRIQTDVLLVKDEVPNAPGKQLHRDALHLAGNALTDPIDSREFQTYLFTIDSRRMTDLKQKIKEVARQIVSEFETDLDGDTVVQFHLNLFEAIESSHLSQSAMKEVEV